MGRAGFFRWLCLRIAKAVKYRTIPLFITFMVMSSILAMFIDSITAVSYTHLDVYKRQEENIALTPYSALAGGRLSKRPGERSKRLEEDSYAKLKYDASREQDELIIGRVAQLAAERNVSMTEIALAWLLTKATSPVAGATKLHHVEGAARAAELTLGEEEINYLEEAYVCLLYTCSCV